MTSVHTMSTILSCDDEEAILKAVANERFVLDNNNNHE